ncbi:hypothetical protein [Streptomyces sp. NPDC055085]
MNSTMRRIATTLSAVMLSATAYSATIGTAHADAAPQPVPMPVNQDLKIPGFSDALSSLIQKAVSGQTVSEADVNALKSTVDTWAASLISGLEPSGASTDLPASITEFFEDPLNDTASLSQ